MRNPIEFVMDLYDHEFQYYRWFIHRRLLFSEIKSEDMKQYINYNIFSNKDHENVGQLLSQTTLMGLSAGVGFGALKYSLDTTTRGVKSAKALPKALGVVLIGTAVGLAYGSVVNATANYRGKKSDFANHALASIITFPLTGALARTNKLQWGMTTAVLGALVVSFLKTAYGGDFLPINGPKQLEHVRSGLYSYQYKPK